MANLTTPDAMTLLTQTFARACIAAARAEMEAQNSSDPSSRTTEAAHAPAETPRPKETWHGAS
jgi:hypothetical protein